VATYYIDNVLGSDSNAGTSSNAPWATIGKITSAAAWVAGNTILLRRGRTFTEAMIFGANGAGGNPITVSWYGPVSEALPKIRPSTANDGAIQFNGYSGYVVDGIDCKSTDNDPAIDARQNKSGANALSSIIRNCLATTPTGSTGAGIQCYVTPGTTYTSQPSGWLIENNYVYDAGNHGIQVTGINSATIRGNLVTGCCRNEACLGIVVDHRLYTGLMTWTVHSGSIYKTTITGTQTPDLPSDQTSVTSLRLKFGANTWSLREDTVTAVGSLTSGTYRLSAGVLYAHFGGSDPNTAGESWMGYGGGRSNVVEYNTVLDTYAFGGNEGVGIQFDFFCGNGTIRGNFVRTNNGKPGIAANDARNMVITGNIVVNTSVGAGGGEGISDGYQGSGPVTCENNTVILNGLSTDRGAINFGSTYALGTFKFNNNIVKGVCNAGVQFYAPTGSPTIEIKNNCINGPTNATSVTGGSPTISGTVTTDPQLAHDYMPRSSAVWTAGLALGWTDFYGMAFVNTIGAVQYKAALVARSYPRFLYDNRLLDAAPAASTTATDYDVDNLTDMRPYSFWQPTALPATITVDCASAVAADFAAIAGHDLYTRRCTVEVRGSTDNFSASDVLIIKRTPSSDEPFILPFDSVSYRYWRIKITGADIPTLAIALIGVALPLPRQHQIGFDPTARSAKSQTNRSVSGYPLGKVTAYEEWAQQISIDVVTWAWIRDTWVPAWKEWLRDEPFLYAWDSTDHPREVYLVQAGSDFKTPTVSGNYAGLEFTLVGVAN
jgi:hypothetical protein